MKKPKNIYDLLNNMDFDIDDYEKEELNDMEKKKFKNEFRKNNKKKFNFKKFGSIAVALLLSILGYLTVNAVIVQNRESTNFYKINQDLNGLTSGSIFSDRKQNSSQEQNANYQLVGNGK